ASGSDYSRARPVQRIRAHEVAHETDRGLAARAMRFGQMRANEVADEADPLRRKQREQLLVGLLEWRARIVGPAEAGLVRHDDELVAGRFQLEQRRYHAGHERLLDRVGETLALGYER